MANAQILRKFLMFSSLIISQFLMAIDRAVDGFLVKSRLSRLALQFPADLFGREPVTKSGCGGSQQGVSEFVGYMLLAVATCGCAWQVAILPVPVCALAMRS